MIDFLSIANQKTATEWAAYTLAIHKWFIAFVPSSVKTGQAPNTQLLSF